MTRSPRLSGDSREDTERAHGAEFALFWLGDRGAKPSDGAESRWAIGSISSPGSLTLTIDVVDAVIVALALMV